jgi:hypothetical protein
MKIVTAVVTQPTYLPWLGYFEQIAKADVFVFLDTVQFMTRSWHSRNRLKGSDGEPFWISVPVEAHAREARLLDIRISANQPQWAAKHLRSMQTHLGSRPYFGNIYPRLESWLMVDHGYLVDLNIKGIRMICELLELSPMFLRASELNAEGKRTQLLVNLCKKIGATRYYSSAGSRAYMEEEMQLFTEAGIDVVYQAWPHPVYPQCKPSFVSHLSVIDALMNIGPQATRSLICSYDDGILQNAMY